MVCLWDFDDIISSIQGMGFGQIADLIATNWYKILSDDKKAKRRMNLAKNRKRTRSDKHLLYFFGIYRKSYEAKRWQCLEE